MNPTGDLTYSLEEHSIIQHFKVNHIRNDSGRFAGSWLRKPDTKAIGKYRYQANQEILHSQMLPTHKGLVRAVLQCHGGVLCDRTCRARSCC